MQRQSKTSVKCRLGVVEYKRYRYYDTVEHKNIYLLEESISVQLESLVLTELKSFLNWIRNTIIGNRMKGRRACWSINGGNNLASILCLYNTNSMDKLFDESASPNEKMHQKNRF